MKRLRLILKGGHGNQLFQYFAGVHLSQRLDRELILDLAWYSQSGNVNGLLDKREFTLQQYGFARNVKTLNQRSIKNSIYVERVLRRLPRTISAALGFHYEADLNIGPLKSRNEIVTSGHWVLNPLLPEKDFLRETLITGIMKTSSRYRDLIEEITEFETVAIHLRLGDYEKFPQVYGHRTTQYYEKAVKHILSNRFKVKPKIWLFSDEPSKAISKLSPAIKFDRVISDSDGLNEAETVSLMAHANAIVCSNSTFSWWAAYLSDDSNLKIYPKEYINGVEVKDTGLYQANWIYL